MKKVHACSLPAMCISMSQVILNCISFARLAYHDKRYVTVSIIRLNVSAASVLALRNWSGHTGRCRKSPPEPASRGDHVRERSVAVPESILRGHRSVYTR